MIYKVGNTKGKKVVVRDEMGKAIPTCFYYDSKKRLAKLYVIAGPAKGIAGRILVNRRKAVTLTIHLPKSTIEVDGVRY